MLEQTLRVADLLHIKHNDAARLLGVEGVVEVLEYVFNTQLSRVAHCPHAVELQSVAHTVFFDEDSRGTATGDEVYALGVKRRNRSVEAASIVGVEEACAVGADE